MATRQDIRTRRKKQKQQQRLTTILIVAGVALIMAAILMMPTIQAAITPVGDFIQPVIKPLPMANANTMGNPDAPVILEIYSDFGCGHCGAFAQTTGQVLIETYIATGQVFMRYNSVGSLLGHPTSLTTIEAAYCAGDQNKFWEFHDLIFANQTSLFANMNQKLNKTYQAYADSLGLDVEAFSDCIKSGKFDDAIQQDYGDALQVQISSTPSFLINGNLIIGNRPYEEFQAAIEAELAQASQ
jgi:protein-disulfide isomerase